ncbi:uncharacterized protein LOC114282726 isoform X2 [Camellia sinensis]|uniref:uncharacterized protein LOC114282726 isoform X2 n=1 Tax=Camellia sinensis TaxID=4442 RepID=UPI00103650FC|nr:uncharacterized protein LOC114282726 isoform X2 [Camellia sinensis]
MLLVLVRSSFDLTYPFFYPRRRRPQSSGLWSPSMALLQHVYVCYLPLARALRSRSLTTIPSRTITIPSSSSSSLKKLPHTDSHVLLGMSEQQLQQLAVDLGQEKYRGKQLHHLLYKRKVKEIQDFSHLPQAFRNDLEEAGWKVGRSPVHRAVTAADGTIKLLIKLEDNTLVETVGIPVEDDKGSVRLTACISSQVGCPLRCSFCATGKGGFSRNLQRHEIVEQDVQIGQRMITISTVGVPNTIKKLASHKLQSTLAVSLHAPNQKLREKIVPSAKSYPLDAIMKDCRDYFLETSRRVSFEYTLLAGVNDSVEHAIELAELLHEWGRGYHVNLIPFNPIEGSEYRRPYKKAVHAFVATLESRKITVSVRQTRGLDASAACGQLRNEFQKSPLLAGSDNLQSQLDIPVSC